MPAIHRGPDRARRSPVRIAAATTAGLLALLALRPGDAAAARGGPDAFGYTWRDDREPGVAYQRFDFRPPPADTYVTEPGDDASTAFIALPFAFPFYGRAYSAVSISEDGWLSLAEAGISDDTPSPLPDPDGPLALVAPLWEDHAIGSRGGGDFIRYQVEADKVVFEWFRTRVEDTGEDATFQVWLMPDGRIRFQYLNVAGDHAATIGIESEDLASGLAVMTMGSAVDGFTVRSKSAVEILPPSDADCSQPVACGETLVDTVRRNPDLMNAYGGCGPGWNGAEVVRTLDVTEMSHVTALLSAGTVENDVFLLPACTELSCLDSGDAVGLDFVPPGSYVLAVDALVGNTPAFRLDVGCWPALVATACGTTTATLDPTSRVASWPCFGTLLDGGERFHRVSVPAAGDLVATLDRADLAVIIMELEGFPLSGARCVAAGWGSAWATDLPAGEYVVAVDGPLGSAGSYELLVDCLPAATVPMSCGRTVSGLLPPSGRLDGWTCGAPGSLPGGEDLREIILPVLATLTITLSADAPASVLLLDGASEGPSSCIARGDTFISYPNAPPGRYVVVVDSVAGASYDLTVECDEPVGSVCTPWEWHDGDVPITGLVPFPVHGDPRFYELATPPLPDDAGWKPAPDPATIGYARSSDICGHTCLTAVDFTYFRSYVRLPQVVTSFQVQFGSIDDGVEVRLNGVTAGIGYLGGGVTVDLVGAPSMRPGELNEILLVQVDDCCTWNELSGTACVVVGSDPPCVATLEPPAEVDALPGQLVALAPASASVTNCFDVEEYRWSSGALVLRDWDPDPSYAHVVGPAPETLTVEVRCRRDERCTASGKVLVDVPPCTASVTAPADVLACPGEIVPLAVAARDLVNCTGVPEYRWSSGATVLQDWTASDTFDHAAGPATETITLEVRCSTWPACTAADDVVVTPPGDPAMPLVTPHLRVRRIGRDVPVLYWPGAPVPAFMGHFHVYRARNEDRLFLRANGDLDVASWTEPSPSDSWLLFYDVVSADGCEREGLD